MGERNMAPGPLLEEKIFTQQHRSLGKQMSTCWISGVGPLFIGDEEEGFGVLFWLFLRSGAETEQPLSFLTIPDFSPTGHSLWSQTQTKPSTWLPKTSEGLLVQPLQDQGREKKPKTFLPVETKNQASQAKNPRPQGTQTLGGEAFKSLPKRPRAPLFSRTCLTATPTISRHRADD